MAEVHHVEALFSGRVQGVGFRYAAFQVAREYEVAGFVENLGDGRVRVEVEGRQKEAEDFLDAIAERMHGYIRKTERTSEARARQFENFAVK